MAATDSQYNIPKTQKAAVLEEWKSPYVIKTDYPVKQPSDLAPGECLVKLECTGLCHSDIHIRNKDWGLDTPLPTIGGHEGIGRVVAIGQHSSNTVKVGDRVGLKWIADVCGKCEMCRKGHESSCPVSFAKTHGFRIPGTFQEYAVSYVDYVTPIPEDLEATATTPLLCAGLTAYKALKQANVSIGQWIAISGAGGGLGHLAVQFAAAMGLRVLAIDTGEKKRKLVLDLGAEKWIDFRESTDLVADVQAATDGLGPEAALVFAGDAKPFNQAIFYLRLKGTLVCVGMPGGSAMLNVPLTLLVGKSLTILGSAIGSRQDMMEVLRIASMGKVKCQHEVRELGDINSAFEDLEAGSVPGRIVLRM